MRRGRQQFRAIKPETLPAAKQSFVASLQEAETRLLRSSSPASLHFTTIAQAINSNKVLLRALLSPVRGIWRRWAGTGELFGVRYLS